MALIILTSLTLSITATATLSSSPLFLGLWVLLLTLIIRIIANITTTTWLGLMIILIYIGGLLVIFAYFVALTPNLIIEGKLIITNLLLSWPIFLSFLLIVEKTDIKSLSHTSIRPLSYLFIEHFTVISILAIILFFALVATVKLVSNVSSPLRPFN